MSRLAAICLIALGVVGVFAQPQGPARTTAWPAGFDSVRATDGEAWIDRSLEAAGLSIHIAHPVDWAFQPYPAHDAKLLSVRNGSSTEVIMIRRPTPHRGSFDGPMARDRLRQLVGAIQQEQVAAGRKIQFESYGQVMISNTLWIWMDVHASTADLPVNPTAAQQFSDVRMWLFATVVDDEYLVADCTLLLPRDVSPGERDAQVQNAEADFGGIMRRLSIDRR